MAISSPAMCFFGGARSAFQVKLCDFGEARRVEQTPPGKQGMGNSRRADVWAFGGILAHLELRLPPFNPAPPLPFFFSVVSGELSPSWPAAIQNLAIRCVLGRKRHSFGPIPKGAGTSAMNVPSLTSKFPSVEVVSFREAAEILAEVATELGPSDSAAQHAALAQHDTTRMPFLHVTTPSLDPPFHQVKAATDLASGWSTESRLAGR